MRGGSEEEGEGGGRGRGRGKRGEGERGGGGRGGEGRERWMKKLHEQVSGGGLPNVLELRCPAARAIHG